MIKYLKIPFITLLTVFVAISSVVMVIATTSDKFIDEANLVEDSDQIDYLTSELERVSQKIGWDLIIYTNYNGVSESKMEFFCDDLYDELNYGYGVNDTGVMLTIDMSSRQLYMLTRGDAKKYFDDYRNDTTLDNIQSYMKSKDYYNAFKEFISDCEDYYDYGISEDGTYDNLYEGNKETNLVKQYVLPSILLGFGVSIITMVVIAVLYKNNGKSATYDLKANSKVKLVEASDKFVTKMVTHHTRSSSSGHSGGGHSSHGGGGRSF